MPENTNERNHIIEQKKHVTEKGDVAVTSHNHVEEAEMENNSVSKNVLRIDDLLNEEKDNPVIVKLNRLKNVGINDEMIINTYNDLAGNVTTKTEALAVLNVIFSRYVEYISELPNGIVLDPISGAIDYDASYEQRIQLGILKDPFEGIDLTQRITVDDILNINREEFDEGFKDFWEKMEFLDSITLYETNLKELSDELNDFLNINVEDLGFTGAIKEHIKEDREYIYSSKYENNPHLFEITRIELELEAAKGTAEYTEILNKRIAFYEKYPEYIGKVPIRDENDNIVPEESKEYEKFLKTYVTQMTLKILYEFKDFSKKQFEELPEEVRRNTLKHIFSGLAYEKDNTRGFQEIYGLCSAFLQRIAPELDISKISEKSQEQELARILSENGVISNDITEIDLSTAIKLGRRSVRGDACRFIENDETSYEMMLEGNTMDDLGVDMRQTVMYKSYMQNYFVGSKVDFSESNVERANKFYQVATITSWIQSKDEALDLRYAALVSMKREYDNLPDSDYKRRKVLEIEQEITSFEESFGTRGKNPDAIYERTEATYDFYRNNMGDASLVKFYTRDMLRMQNGITYESLEPEEKKAYIRNTLVGLDYLKSIDNNDFFLPKIVLRRLELMNTDEKQYVTFAEDGSFNINKELILQEYNDISDYTWGSFDELVASSVLRKDEYILKKLGDYSQLEESEFVQLEDEDDWDLSIQQIENARHESNKKQLLAIKKKELFRGYENLGLSDSLTLHIQDDLLFLANSKYEADPKLYEIAMLEVIRERKFVKEDVEKAEERVEAFYQENPEYRGKVFTLDEKGYINEDERKDFEKFKRLQSTQYTIAKLGKYKDFSRDEFRKLPKEEQKEMMIAALSGLACRNLKERAYSEIGQLCEDFIKKIEPELNLKKYFKQEEKEKFAKFAIEYLGYDENTTEIELTSLMKFSKIQIQESVLEKLQNNQRQNTVAEPVIEENVQAIDDATYEAAVERDAVQPVDMNVSGIEERQAVVTEARQEPVSEQRADVPEKETGTIENSSYYENESLSGVDLKPKNIDVYIQTKKEEVQKNDVGEELNNNSLTSKLKRLILDMRDRIFAKLPNKTRRLGSGTQEIEGGTTVTTSENQTKNNPPPNPNWLTQTAQTPTAENSQKNQTRDQGKGEDGGLEI